MYKNKIIACAVICASINFAMAMMAPEKTDVSIKNDTSYILRVHLKTKNENQGFVTNDDKTYSHIAEDAAKWTDLARHLLPGGTFDIENFKSDDTLTAYLIELDTKKVKTGTDITVTLPYAAFSKPGTTIMHVGLEVTPYLFGNLFGKTEKMKIHSEYNPKTIKELKELAEGKITKIPDYEPTLKEIEKLGSWRKVLHLIKDQDLHSITQAHIFSALGFKQGAIPPALEILGPDLVDLDPASPDATPKKVYKQLTNTLHQDRYSATRDLEKIEKAKVVNQVLNNAKDDLMAQNLF